MGFEYALVHLKYTIPPALLLTLIYRPLLNRLDVYKIVFLIVIAVVSTIPWDSYLIQRQIWTYPPSVIIGPKLFQIPAEELFFFVIQTYNTSLLYLILSRPLLHPTFLSKHGKTIVERLGQVVLLGVVVVGAILVRMSGEGTYMGLILVWAAPFALLLWSLSSQFLTRLPYSSTVAPIAISTLYLWLVDTLALRRGTWSIEPGTKLGIHIWEGLEIEEAVFFLATNTMIVFGLVAFDHAMAVIETFPTIFPTVAELPSPLALILALLLSPSEYDGDRVEGVQEAVIRLQKKSRSFFLASAAFTGRLRIDLILLYSFCRTADDLVDNAAGQAEAKEWLEKLARYLELDYASKERGSFPKREEVQTYVSENFPQTTQSALLLLPTHLLPAKPLEDLLEGFRTDLKFHSTKVDNFPIASEHDLMTYAARVAGTVAELCLALVFHHTHSDTTKSQQNSLILAGGRMGIALQFVNIARDIATDAKMKRVYLPTSWLKQKDLTPESVVRIPKGIEIEILRRRLLDKAFSIYREAKPDMDHLPPDARAPMRVAVESYMEIGRVIRRGRYQMKQGRATVPKLRRLTVAWRALNER